MSAYRIQRYLLREIAAPMILALFIFTFVLIMGRSQKLMDLVIDKGVPFGDVAALFADLLPAFLVLTIPIAFLIGILLAFGRLSGESELIALKACGVSLPMLMRPVLLLAGVAAFSTLILTLYYEPRANADFKRQIFTIASKKATVGLKPMTFNNSIDGIVLYAGQIDERAGRMQDIFIADERSEEAPATVFAKTGQVLIDSEAQNLQLRLENGTIHRRDQRRPDTFQTVSFDSYALRIDMNQDKTPGAKNVRRESELDLPALLAARRGENTPKEQRILDAGLQRRFIMASTPLIFALVGVPLGIRSHRSGRGSGFAAALLIFLLFYVLFSFAKTLVVDLGLPALCMWLPVLIFAVAGLFLVRHVSRENELSFDFAPLFRRLRGRKGSE